MTFFLHSHGIAHPHRSAKLAHFVLALSLSLAAASLSQQARAHDSPNPDLTKSDAPSRGASNVSPEVAQRAAAIARQTMSPFCPGRTLSDCPSEYATAWRKDIRAMVAAGMSSDEIQKELESRVGENLSGSPNRNASYGVSIGLALGAGLVLFFVLSRLRLNSAASRAKSKEEGAAASDSDASATPAVDDRRLQEELELAGENDD